MMMYCLTLCLNMKRWALLAPWALLCCAGIPQAEAIAPQAEEAPMVAMKGNHAAATKGVVELLQALPQPAGAPSNRPAIFSANSYGQQALNFQMTSNNSGDILDFYRESLAKENYTERTINTTTGAWGFSVVFIPPADFPLKPESSTSEPALQVGDSLTVNGSDSPQVMLVIQATQLSPNSVNINMRYEEL